MALTGEHVDLIALSVFRFSTASTASFMIQSPCSACKCLADYHTPFMALDGLTAIVTGVESGVGTLAVKLARHGARGTDFKEAMADVTRKGS